MLNAKVKSMLNAKVKLCQALRYCRSGGSGGGRRQLWAACQHGGATRPSTGHTHVRMYTWCTHDAHIMRTGCTQDVHRMYTWCTHDVINCTKVNSMHLKKTICKFKTFLHHNFASKYHSPDIEVLIEVIFSYLELKLYC